MKLLIVDDSALMRRFLQDCFAGMGSVELLLARNGRDALQVIAEHDPDVVTLDINMPEMDGLTCLAHIMEASPRPVIMVSSLTEKGALATFEALELGAVDFIAKPGGTVSLNMDLIYEELRGKVMSAARKRSNFSVAARRVPEPVVSAPAPRPRRPLRVASGDVGADLVIIGCSTGGPKVLGPLLQCLPEDFPAPIVIAQHMPERFTGIFARRLAEECAIGVVEVTEPMRLLPGQAYLAPGGRDMLVSAPAALLTASPVPADAGFIWHPSVSRLTASALDCVKPERMIGIMLTGMGDDGSVEMARLKQEGGRTIAESEETAAIFGMPQKLIEKNGATMVLPADRIGLQLTSWARRAETGRRLTCH